MNNYGILQRTLHDLVFKFHNINIFLYEFEKFVFLNKTDDIVNEKHIFITGLPRSGTTSILNFLYSKNVFGTLKYKNMPFLLSPNIIKIFGDRKFPKAQRLHNDGISFDLNSPEAFDEYFFKNVSYLQNKELINYIKLILFSENKKRYISKNNLNYKRIEEISSIFPNSIFLIPFRLPEQHSLSLLNQHKHFKKLQEKDKFILKYMNYIGHNEFGHGHQPWNKNVGFDDNTLDYWLNQWFLFYKDILKKYSENDNVYFINYERLSSIKYLDQLSYLLNVKLDKVKFFKNSNKDKISSKYSTKIHKISLDLYNELDKKLLLKNH